MTTSVQLLDAVALTADVIEHKLTRGQVGTVVEQLAPGVVLVEFSDNDGHAFAIVPVPAENLLVLHFELAEAV